ARAQLPQPLAGRAGGIGRAVQGTLFADQLGARGAAASAPVDELVAHVLDAVRVLLLVALQPLGDDAHARVLVAHAAVGDVGALLGVEAEVVRGQELVAPGQGDVAFQVGDLAVHAAQRVAAD